MSDFTPVLSEMVKLNVGLFFFIVASKLFSGMVAFIFF